MGKGSLSSSFGIVLKNNIVLLSEVVGDLSVKAAFSRSAVETLVFA